MSRYAQRRRRGGGGPIPAAAPEPILITGVIATGTRTFQITFSAPITYDNSGNLTDFHIDLQNVLVTGSGSSSLNVETPSSTGSGLPWEAPDQPPEISEPLVVPDSGTTI